MIFEYSILFIWVCVLVVLRYKSYRLDCEYENIKRGLRHTDTKMIGDK